MRIKQRWVFSAGFLICVFLMAMALYFEHIQGLDPCPLCVFQRGAVIVFGLICLLAAIHNPYRTGRIVYSTLLWLSAAAGISVAGRHVWLQSLPADQVPACGPGLSYLWDVFPLLDVLQFVFKGSGECAEEKPWGILGIDMPGSMAGWMLVIFIGFAIASIAINFSKAVVRN